MRLINVCVVRFVAIFFLSIAGAPFFPVLAAGPAVPVEAARVEKEVWSLDLDALGTLAAEDQVIISSEIPARVKGLPFAEGEPVAAGDLLASFEDDVYRAELNEALAALDLAKVQFERVRQLRTKNLLTPQEYDEANAQLASARSREAAAVARLQKTQILAPFAGRMGLRQVSRGAYLKAGDPIVTLVSLHPMEVHFSLPEGRFPLLQPGQPLTLQTEAFPEKVFHGVLKQMDARLEENSRTLSLRGSVENPEGQLRPGMFAHVRLSLVQPAQLVIPEEAVMPSAKGASVFKLQEGGAVVSTPILTGARQVGKLAVLSGLAEGDRVVTRGQQKLRDGALVVLPSQ